MVAYFLAAVIVWFCNAYFGMDCDPVLLIVSFLIFILLYAIISNQSNIERLMGRRHYDLSMLPAGMRRYNLLLICAGFVLVVLGLFFQTPDVYKRQVLIEYLKLTEPQAHRYIEKQAMDLGLTRRQVALNILKTYES